MSDEKVLINNGVDLKSSLELLGDLKTYNRVLNEFLKNIDERVEKIKKVKEEKKYDEYATLIHSLKSDGRYLGFTTFADMAMAHEMEAKDKNQSYIDEHFDELMQELNKMINVLRKCIVSKPIEIKDDSKKDKAVLVVDDSAVIRTFISKLLNDQFEIVLAKDGKEAIDFINATVKGKIKVVLLDLNMPNVNGFDVLDYFRDNNLFDIYPVSIISGINDKETIDKAFKYPIVDMLLKPFTEADVRRIVERTDTKK